MITKQTAIEFLLEKWFSNDRLLFYTDFEKALKIEEKQIYDADTIKKREKKEEKRIFDPENQQNQLETQNSVNKDYSDFDKAVEPAIRYLFKNHHPHTKIYIDYSNAELLEGQKTHNLNEEVPD